MAFYDGLGKKIQQTGQGAIDKTKKGAESVKLNSAINNLDREIKEEYTEIGRIYYQKHANDVEDPDLIPHFQKVSENLAEIQNNRDQIDALKGLQKCPSCGMSISEDMTFCKYCGARLVPEFTAAGQTAEETAAEPAAEAVVAPEPAPEAEAAEEPAAEAPAFCAHCGAKLEPGTAFCPSCGQKVE